MNMNNNSTNNSLVQNPDLLLSCAMDQNQNEFRLVDHCYSISTNQNSSNLMTENLINSSTTTITGRQISRNQQYLVDQFIQRVEVPIEQQNEIKEEILDFNIFELLQSEEPEMARLLDQTECINYLPQISVNTATNVLDNATSTLPKNLSSSSLSSVLMELTKTSQQDELAEEPVKPVIFKFDDIDQSQMHSSFKELCDLLSIKTVNKGSNDGKLKVLTPPLTPTEHLKPSRTSMRLVHKRNIKKEIDYDEPVITKRVNKRKKSNSSDSDDDSVTTDDNKSNMKLLNSSNENSMDFSSGDYIFYNDDDDDLENVERNSDDDELDDEDSSNSENCSSSGRFSHRENKSMSSKKSKFMLDTPVKKDSNKEAANRYRLKKISEKDKLFETRFNLEKENDSVKRRIELVQTEINHLKNILVQMILTKSVLNNSKV